MKIALITDGSCDLPPDLAESRGIEVVPHHVMWGSQSYRSGVDITAEAFYERLVREPQLPKTSQPSPGEFAEHYRRVRDKYQADTILVVTLSKHLSGTHQSATTARDLVDFPVQV